MKITLLLSLSLSLWFSIAYAQAPKKGEAKVTNTVMDFEAEVIDGQKKAPELFLQLDSEKAELNTILYDRRNFNDFQPVNTLLRPLFSDSKKPNGGVQK